MNRPALALVLTALPVLLSGVSAAHAASPARSADPYFTGVQDEVMMQNLTCEDLAVFLNKNLGDPMLVPAKILDEPQHTRETSETLFGQTLTRLILTASNYPAANHPIGSPAPCTRILPIAAGPDPSACDGSNSGGIPSLGMTTSLAPPEFHPGEIKLMGLFDHAAKYKNCRH